MGKPKQVGSLKPSMSTCRRLKVVAAKQGRGMNSLAEEILDNYLDSVEGDAAAISVACKQREHANAIGVVTEEVQTRPAEAE